MKENNSETVANPQEQAKRILESFEEKYPQREKVVEAKTFVRIKSFLERISVGTPIDSVKYREDGDMSKTREIKNFGRESKPITITSLFYNPTKKDIVISCKANTEINSGNLSIEYQGDEKLFKFDLSWLTNSK